MAQSFHLRALRIAARQLGGEPQLRAYLMVPASDLFRWMHGHEPVPQHVMVKVLGLLSERESTPDIPATPTAGEKRNLV